MEKKTARSIGAGHTTAMAKSSRKVMSSSSSNSSTTSATNTHASSAAVMILAPSWNERSATMTISIKNVSNHLLTIINCLKRKNYTKRHSETTHAQLHLHAVVSLKQHRTIPQSPQTMVTATILKMPTTTPIKAQTMRSKNLATFSNASWQNATTQTLICVAKPHVADAT